MFDLQAKICIVTGGARGIGKAICTKMAAQGAKVVIADLLEEAAEQTAKEIRDGGGEAISVRTDICDLNQVREMVTKTREAFGPVNVLVNNAGWDKMAPFIETTPDLWQKIIDINYRGVLNCVHTVAPGMIEAGKGKIVSIASDAARAGSSGEAVYSGAKAAIIAFSKAMARELARNNVNVNVVCPGPTPTQLTEEMKADSEMNRKIIASMEKIIPLRKLGAPEDIAHAVVFLASDEASFITGQVLSVSGGLTMA